MQVLIIEDEQLASDKLQMLLHEVADHIEVHDVLESVSQAVAWLQANEADLIFMDIHLSDDLSFKIFDQVDLNTPIIFTTAYDEYAIKAFDQNSLAYLMKPISREALKKAIDKYERLNQPQLNLNDSLKNLLKQYTQAEVPVPKKKRIMVSYGGKMMTIPLERAALFYAQDRAVYLATEEGKRYVVDETLEKIETWVDESQFFRVNRKYLININAVKEAIHYSARKLKLNLAIETPDLVLVPTEKITRFKTWLNS